MKRILVGLWRGLKAFRSFMGMMLFLVIMVGLIAVLLNDPKPKVPDGAALVLNLRGALVEQTTEREPLELLQSDFGSNIPKQAQLRDVLDAIARAADDERIKVLVLALDEFTGGGPSKLHRVGDAIDSFKKKGKPVIAQGDSYSQVQYLLAAHADTILINPQGGIFFQGYGRFRFYYKALLDKLKVSINIFRVGTFKSAVEPFIRDDMSDAASEANRAFLGVLWNNYTDDVEAARELAPGAIGAYVENLSEVLRAAGGDAGKAALDAGLADQLATRTEQRAHIAGLVGKGNKTQPFNGISYQKYLRATATNDISGGAKIGVIVAVGLIVDGEAPRGTIGGDTVARLIRRARVDDNVKALVLRVDSGGGSAFASEVIRQELIEAKRAGKPVIASMGSVAASGGYWISASADEIWAAPTTITGSIGIFGLFPTIEKSLATVGVHNDGVGTTSLSGQLNPARELGPGVADLLQQTIEEGYERFISLVAEGRGKTAEEVDAIAQGRVWSGQTALALGLVDNLGTLEDAIAAAAARAGIEDYEIEYFEKKPSLTQQILTGLLKRARVALGDNEPIPEVPLFTQLRRLVRDLTMLARLNDPGGAYALCLQCEVLER